MTSTSNSIGFCSATFSVAGGCGATAGVDLGSAVMTGGGVVATTSGLADSIGWATIFSGTAVTRGTSFDFPLSTSSSIGRSWLLRILERDAAISVGGLRLLSLWSSVDWPTAVWPAPESHPSKYDDRGAPLLPEQQLDFRGIHLPVWQQYRWVAVRPPQHPALIKSAAAKARQTADSRR